MSKSIISFSPGIGTIAEYTALVKPKGDIVYSVKQLGFGEVLTLDELYYNYFNNIDESKLFKRLLRKSGRFIKKLTNLRALNNFFERNHYNDVLIVQYPLYRDVSPELADLVTEKIGGLKNTKKIVLIHDLESFNRGQNGVLSKDKELQLLKKFDHIIVHNEKMQQLIKQEGDHIKYWNLDIFDYVEFGEHNFEEKKNKRKVFFAGNLIKSSFIRELKKVKSYEFHIYGPHFNEAWVGQNVTYHGILDSKAILDEGKKYSFGLVWDGNSIKDLEGRFEKYMKFNNPYKLSSNIVSGLPTITSTKSGIAEFVKANHIGITVKSLLDLDNLQLSEDEYKSMLFNVNVLRQKIVKGDRIKEVIKLILND